MAELRVDQAKIERLLGQALEDAAEVLEPEFILTIESSIFPWPGVTRRRNGEEVFTPRNIVDNENFKESQSYTPMGFLMVRFLWDIEYALVIFYGFTTRSGGQYPGRDWIGETFNRIDPLQVFAASARRVFGR